MSKPHPTAVKSFNLNHVSYDKFRPSFQKPLVDKFLRDLKLIDSKPLTSKKILELASGTGKFTENLVNYGWKENLVVVEPSEGMLDSFKKNFPQVKAFQGSSYQIPVESGSFDAVIIAQGFHWFSDLDSLKEIKRVLKPEGKFGCVWNFDGISNALQTTNPYSYLLDPSLKAEDDSLRPKEFANSMMSQHVWYQKVTEFMYNFDAKVPQYRHGKWRKVWEDNPYFKPGIESFYFYPLMIQQEHVFDYWLTRSYITDLPEVEQKRAKAKVDVIMSQWVEDKDKTVVDGEEYLQRIMGTHCVVSE